MHFRVLLSSWYIIYEYSTHLALNDERETVLYFSWSNSISRDSGNKNFFMNCLAYQKNEEYINAFNMIIKYVR